MSLWRWREALLIQGEERCLSPPKIKKQRASSSDSRNTSETIVASKTLLETEVMDSSNFTSDFTGLNFTLFKQVRTWLLLVFSCQKSRFLPHNFLVAKLFRDFSEGNNEPSKGRRPRAWDHWSCSAIFQNKSFFIMSLKSFFSFQALLNIKRQAARGNASQDW